jgi:predicted  nucleic acid-binding Zn-ribbon protein
VLQSVRCLECGSPYAKPVGGGTAAANPGCPDCGYLGWLPFSGEPGSPLLRSAGDPPPRLFA